MTGFENLLKPKLLSWLGYSFSLTPEGMSSFDIAGAAHSLVASVIALIQQVKRNVDCHREVKTLLDELAALYRNRFQNIASEANKGI